MRYLIGFMFALALAALPQSVSAQDAEEDTSPEPSAEEPTPSSEPAPEEPAPTSEPAPQEPALQLELDAAGIEVVPSPPRTADGYTLEEMERRVRRAKWGLGVSVPFIWIGASVAIIGTVSFSQSVPGEEESPTALIATSTVMGVGGLGGTIASGVLLRRRKRELRSLEQAHYGIPTRTRRGYTLEEAELRLKRARIGLGVSAGISVLGVALLIPGIVGECRPAPDGTHSTTPRCDPLTITGATFIMAGVVGMITTGFLSLRRKRERDSLREAHYGRPRRVQWDLARSRLVF
jgi:hypothetical protein